MVPFFLGVPLACLEHCPASRGLRLSMAASFRFSRGWSGTLPRFEGIETSSYGLLSLTTTGSGTLPRFEGIETTSSQPVCIIHHSSGTLPRFEGIETSGGDSNISRSSLSLEHCPASRGLRQYQPRILGKDGFVWNIAPLRGD